LIWSMFSRKFLKIAGMVTVLLTSDWDPMVLWNQKLHSKISFKIYCNLLVQAIHPPAKDWMMLSKLHLR
jgi:hypothetical protein